MNLRSPTITRPATCQDVLDASPGMVAGLIRGALHPRLRQRPKHNRAIMRLGVMLG